MKVLSIIVALLTTSSLWGQIDTRITPAPAPPQQQSSDQPTSKWTGTPLTGFLSETLGPNFKEGLETTFAVSESATNESEPIGGTGYSVDEYSRLDGTASFHRDWTQGTMLVQYAAGTNIYVKNSSSDQQFHRLTANESFKVGRWNLSLGEVFNYLPQSNFGFDPARSLGNGLAQGNEQGPDLFLPANIIERNASGQMSAQYLLGPRASVSMTGSFSDLHFSGSAPGTVLADSEMISAGGQYSYALNAKESLGAGYNFGQSRAIGFGSLVQTHSAFASYQRNIGQHLSLQASAGPEFTSFNQNGVDVSLGAATTVTASATYTLSRTSFGTSYFRGTNAGSGLFLGSKADDIRAFVNRQIGHSFNLSFAGGFARNTNLGVPSINSTQRFDSTYASATVERSFGSTISAFVSYSFQNQNISALCNATGCTPFPMFHTGTIGFRFHIHPLTMKP